MPINLPKSVGKLNVMPTMGSGALDLEKYVFHSYYIRELTYEVESIAQKTKKLFFANADRL